MPLFRMQVVIKDPVKFLSELLYFNIHRLEQYLYYSDINPFVDNVSYVNYVRFIYECYLNDLYIIQTRFRKLINSIADEKRFKFKENELNFIQISLLFAIFIITKHLFILSKNNL